MSTNIFHKTLKATAALIDFSLLFQLLFVPLSFFLTARAVQAETVPVVEFSYNDDTHEFQLAVEPVQSLEYTVEYEAEGYENSFGFTGTEKANEQGRVEIRRAAESESGSDVILYNVDFGRLSIEAELQNGDAYSFSSPFRIQAGELKLMNTPQTPSGYWTQVVAHTPYESPENDLVSVTFTSLPEQSGDLRIEEITLSDEQMSELGSSNKTAYEITSSMENGSFTYDLTLPNLTGSQDVQVQYSEDGETFEVANPEELTVEKKQENSIITLRGLDHFTVFVVTGVDNSGTCTGASITTSGSDTCYTSLQAAIDAATSGETIDIHTNLTTTSAVNVTKTLTINGNGHTISPTFTGPGAGNENNATLRIISQANIILNNLIINGVGGTALHGINVFGSSNIVLNTITSKDNDKSGIAVNGSTVTVNNVTTSGNGWHGMNVDRGSGLPNAGVLTVTGVSKQSDVAHIYIDNTANGSVIDSENQYTSAHINLDGTHPNDLRYTLIPPVKNIDTGETFATIKQAVQDGDTVNGHTIEVKGTLTVTEKTNVNKDLTIRGVNSATINTSGTAQLFTITSNGVTIEDLNFVKTDTTNQHFIGVQADNFTLQNSTFTGKFVPPTGETSRVLVVSNGVDNALITGNSFSNLRQPAYLNNGSAGTISNNYVTNTRGWVVEKNSSFAFTGNTWGTNTDGDKPVDIAIINGSDLNTPNNYTCILPSIVAANNNAAIDDQHPGTCPDTTMPEAAVISPENGAIIRGTHRFVVEATDASGITKILFNLNGKSYGGQLVKGDGDTWYVDIDTTTIPDGVHHVVLRTTDGAGNTKYWNNRKDIHSFTIDNTQPVIEILQPTSGSVVSGEVTIQARITETGSGLSYQWAKFSLESDLSIQSEAKQLQLVPGETDLYEVVLDTRTTQDGIYRIGVDVSDNVGNSRSAVNQNITIDNTAPAAPEIVFPTAEQNFTTTPILNDWTDVSDLSGISHYRIEYVYDDGHTFSNGPYREATISQRNHAPGTQEQGGVKIRVQAFDNAGNEGAWSEWRHYYYDFTKPAAPVIGGFINPNFVCGATTNSANITVDWSDVVDNESGFQQYEYFIDYPTPTGGRGQWTTTLASSQYSGHLNPGLHQIKVRALDKAGNYSDWSNTCDITYDNTAPDVQITSHAEGETLTNAGVVEIIGSITDNLKLLRYYFTIRDADGALATGTAPYQVNTSSVSAIMSYNWDTSLVANGVYTLMLEARDAAGNKDAGSTHKVKVNVNNVLPSPSPSPSPSPEPEGQTLGASTSSGTGGSTTSAKSAKAPVCSAVVPNAVSGLGIASTATGATLNWTRPAGEITHYALEFVRLDAAGNETGRYGVATLGNSDTTSFTIENLPGGSSYRFELFAVNDCAPGARAVATSALITAPGAPDLESGEVVITPNTGEAEVLGASTDENIVDENEEDAKDSSNAPSFLGQVLGASNENCQAASWWWIFLPAFIAGLGLLHLLLNGKLRALAALLLLLGTGFGLHQTNCSPWIWIGLIGLVTLGSILMSLSAKTLRASAAKRG